MSKAGYPCVCISLQYTATVSESCNCLKSNHRDKRKAGLTPRLNCQPGRRLTSQAPAANWAGPWAKQSSLCEANGGEGSRLTWASCISWLKAHTWSDDRGERWKANNSYALKAVSMPRTANPILCLGRRFLEETEFNSISQKLIGTLDKILSW